MPRDKVTMNVGKERRRGFGPHVPHTGRATQFRKKGKRVRVEEISTNNNVQNIICKETVSMVAFNSPGTVSMTVAASPAIRAIRTGALEMLQKRKSSPREMVLLETCPNRWIVLSQNTLLKHSTTWRGF